MKVNRHIGVLQFSGEEGDSLTVRFDNRGEPFREGITVALDNSSMRREASVFLTNMEARELRDFLNQMFPAEVR